MCMDDLDADGNEINFSLFGQHGSDYRYVEMNVVACVPEQLTPENAHKADTACIMDYNDEKAVKDRL
jgi:hypothetical protein